MNLRAKLIALSLLLLFSCVREKSIEAKRYETEICQETCYEPITFYVFTEFKPSSDAEEETVAYVKKHYKEAVAQTVVCDQPASVKLAQALLESGRGKSYLATYANNHFGVKCIRYKCAKGHCIVRADDNENDKFLIFRDAEHSYYEHSKLIARVYKHCSGSYTEWCDCLQHESPSYATSKAYAQTLKGIIGKYKLYEFDEKF